MRGTKLESIIINGDGDFLHHAFLIEGDREVIRAELFDFFEEEIDVRTKGNPDFLYLSFESFGIDEGRKLKEYQTSKAIEEGRRYFIIDAASFTGEAQNSLLKIFEDPAPNTHFFIILPSVDGILPTLRSRFLIISHGTKYKTHAEEAKDAISVNEFFIASASQRIEMVKGVIEGKNKSAVLELLNQIEEVVHNELVSKNTKSEECKKNAAKILQEITRLRGYLHDRSSSIKLILEHVALILPQK